MIVQKFRTHQPSFLCLSARQNGEERSVFLIRVKSLGTAAITRCSENIMGKIPENFIWCDKKTKNELFLKDHNILSLKPNGQLILLKWTIKVSLNYTEERAKQIQQKMSSGGLELRTFFDAILTPSWLY